MSKSSSKSKKHKNLKHKEEGFVTRMLKTIFEYDVEFAVGGRKKK